MTESEVGLENAFCVSVMHMVDPSTFWITEPLGENMSVARQELQHLEERLAGHFRRSYSSQKGNYTPDEEELVAVQHPETGRWHRAEVGCVLHMSRGFVYDVFLVDHGQSLQVRSSAIRELPGTCRSLDYQAFQIVLYGIVPTTVEMDYDDMKMKRKVNNCWTAAAFRFVKTLLDESVCCWVTYQSGNERKICGDLHIKLPTRIISLSSELCNKQYALLSEELFVEALTTTKNAKQSLFGKITSLQSPVDSFDGSNKSTSPLSSQNDTTESSKHRHIKDYIREHNEQQARRENETVKRIENWRRNIISSPTNVEDYKDSFQDDESDNETPIGRGISSQRRKRREATPGQNFSSSKLEDSLNTSSSSETQSADESKVSSMLDLLDLLSPQSTNSPSAVSQPSFGNTNTSPSPVTYLPAGTNIANCQQLMAPKNKTNKSKANGTLNYSFKCEKMSNQQKHSTILDKPIFNGSNIQTKKVHSPVVNNSEFSERVTVKTEQRTLSLSQFVQEKRNRTSENNRSKIETNGSVRSVVAEEEKPSHSSNFIQDIVNSVVKTTQSKRQVLLDDIKKTSLPADSIPEMKAVLPQVALKALLKRESSVNNVQQSTPTNSAAGLLPALSASSQLPKLSAGHKIANRIQMSRILIHGNMGTRPIQSIAEANFPKEIHQALGKMDFKNPMRIQMYAWPAIMRGHYTLLVGPSQCGKTLSYIVPLVSFMHTPDIYSELQEGNGPLVLVLCSNSKSAHFIYDTCCKLVALSNLPDVQVQIAYGGGREQELKDVLANGCKILISTPRCFLRLLQCSRHITNVDRLAHLVLDEVDVIANKFLPELKEILMVCKKMLVQRAKVTLPVQLIAASEKWCPAVDQFSQYISQNFLVCISGYLEAAVYAKLRPKLHVLSAADKPQVTLEILDGHQGLYKTVIICQTPAEVEEVVPFLKSQCYQVLVAHENMNSYSNSEVRHCWKSAIVPGAYPVLVCTDDVLPELDVCDALWLIHYSLPQTKTGFGYRFSCLMNNYNNMFQKRAENADSPECTVHIFADKDKNTKELPEIVQFLKRLSVPIAPDIEVKTVEIMQQKEIGKCNAPLCYFVKAFGECMKRTSCASRHVILDSVDKSINFPTCGEVKVKILHVHNASHFSVRLLEHTDSTGNFVHIPDEYFSICMTIYKHYSDEINRRLHGIPKIGDVCSVESKLNIYQRVEVTDIVKEDSSSIPEEVRVKFLDEGPYTTVKVFQLIALPEELQHLPPQVVDVFLCNVMPCDLDTEWSETANFRITDWINKINKQEEEGKYLVGKIMLSAKNTLWLDPLECRSYLSSVDTQVMEFSLSKELVKCKLAVSNPDHLTKLYELCRMGKLAIPNYEKVPAVKKMEPKTPALPPPQWAYLDKETYQQVNFVFADSPQHFFVRQNKFHDSFQRLVNELQKCEKTKPKDFHLAKGVCCLGKFPEDGMWYRAQVLQMLQGDRVSLFFVDHGDSATVGMDDIAPITEKFITKLPFQAIECSMAGITPADGDTWSEEAIDALYDFTDSIIPFAKVFDAMPAKCTGGKMYKVLLIDTSTNVDIVLNKLFIEKNLARTVESEQYWEGLSLVRKEEEEESDDDDSKDPDTEPNTQIVKLSDLDKVESLPKTDMGDENLNSFEDEGYDFQIDDMREFLLDMMGLNRKESEPLPSIRPTPDSPDANSDISEDTLTDVESEETDHEPECIPSIISKTRIPQVLWLQDDCTVDLRIKLAGVKEYYLGWDINHTQFSTKMEKDIYEVTLDLYGPINVSSVRHEAKGLFVQIKMEKVVAGFQWPRLLRSRCKHPWLKLDIERYRGEGESDEEDVPKSNKATEELCSSDEKADISETAVTKSETILPDILVQCSDDDDNDSGSDVFEPNDGPYDPFDPLN
ncbi:putative ATP-dependent RNA helicase TDRD12 [Periplaneta americana]|uniref:putative ATP-dependent RNA helicase TDRD12 n=1 Tax=Periplaneta americana TaxID=6978 RepID=UPI0037E81CAF